MATTKKLDVQKRARTSTAADRRGKDRRVQVSAVEIERRKAERRAKAPRRRQIDPTTCEREYSDDEIEFMRAMDSYKRSSGRMFPTCSEILEVIRGLGYVKTAPVVELPGPETVEMAAGMLAS